MKISYRENELTPEEYSLLREAVGWYIYPEMQAKKALQNSFFTVSAFVDGKLAGMGRLVGDGVIYWYFQDVIVCPDFQGKGIGFGIVERLVEYAKEHSMKGTKTAISLMAAKGKEEFYQQFGFLIRPNETQGAGMNMIVDIEE